MKRLWMLAGITGLALLWGCGEKETVVRITEPPEIDHSAIDEYIEVTETKVGPEGLNVVISGKAKVALGEGVALDVERFQGSTKVDTVRARIAQTKQPEMPAGAQTGTPVEGERLPPPYMMTGPPPIPPIEAGDPVTIAMDATTEGGKISRLVIRPRLQ